MSARIYAAPAQEALGVALSKILGIPLGKVLIGSFPDGERNIRLLDDPAGLTVIFLFSTGPPIDVNTLSLAFLADAAKRAGAKSVVAAIPYLGYSRGDKIAQRGDPVNCRVIADLLQGAGIDFLVTLDLHNPAIPGFFKIPVFEASAIDLLARSFQPEENTVVVAPDAGAFKRAARFASLMGLPLAIAFKERPDLEAKVLRLCGELEGKEAIVVDDMISTGGTILEVGEQLLQRGIRAIDVAATHPVLIHGAIERLKKLAVRRFLVTDSLPFEPPEDWPACEAVSIAPLLAPLIRACL